MRELLGQPEILVLPGVHDALSARLATRTGFDALASGGNAATGTLLGAPDMGQLGMRDFADHYARIAAASGVPVLADADTGFGGVHNVAQTVRSFERAGLAGLFIEDQVTPKRCGYLAGKAVIPVADQIAKLRAALDARRDPAFVLCARTDALAVEGIDAAIDRAGRYQQEGVDMVFVQGADTPETLARVCKAIPGFHLANVSQAAGATNLTVDTAQAAGAAAVMFPIAALLAAAAAMQHVLQALHRDRSLAGVASVLMPMAHYNEVTDLPGVQADEDRWTLQPG
ncbi:oxaloacetate decarboxylase [Acidisphaera sp. L21]|uniref:isocitrate lyase/PEP mutase family protein n=1 Tax=Acidisphaera sp. L21 TaxID=1641851 RepID=UPI00131C22DF|nr:oxaloacetate decarboxylase [Acidisphaera sp. L21]